MCADAGYPDVLAHYKAVPKGMSHDGKGRPALCYAHAHGQVPGFFKKADRDRLSVGKQVEEKKVEAEQEVIPPLRAGDVKREAEQIGKMKVFDPAVARRHPPTFTERVCRCGCENKFMPNSPRQVFILGHRPSKFKGQISIERSVTHTEKVVVEAPKTFTIGRQVTLVVPHAKPTAQVALTPKLAQAVWESLTMEQKFKLFDVEGMWKDWDDDFRMSIVSKVLLLHPENFTKTEANNG